MPSANVPWSLPDLGEIDAEGHWFSGRSERQRSLRARSATLERSVRDWLGTEATADLVDTAIRQLALGATLQLGGTRLSLLNFGALAIEFPDADVTFVDLRSGTVR